MNTERIRHSGAFALLVALLVATPGAAWGLQEAAQQTTLLSVTNVSLESAYSLAVTVCRGEMGENRRCTVEALSDESMLAVTADPDAIGRIRALLSEFDRLPETRAFHIVVLSASRTGTGSADLPDGAQQALADVSEFLPYTNFDVLGSGWLRTSRYGNTTLPGPMEFSAEIEFRPSLDPTAPILVERFSVFRHIPATYNTAGDVAQVADTRGILQTTFTIDPGETVVVGTSKLNGDDEAVVVLLTVVQN